MHFEWTFGCQHEVMRQDVVNVFEKDHTLHIFRGRTSTIQPFTSGMTRRSYSKILRCVPEAQEKGYSSRHDQGVPPESSDEPIRVGQGMQGAYLNTQFPLCHLTFIVAVHIILFCVQ